MSAGVDGEWLVNHTTGAPARLRAQVLEYYASAPAGVLTDRLAAAGDAALSAATTSGRGRDTALDLLAADALITLALLATAQQAPATLADVAVALRLRAAVVI